MLSVWICTKNRSALLRETLESLAAVDPPTGPWEVVLVDNGSTDDTPDLIRSFAGRLPLVAAVEERPGLGNARCRAAAVASGENCVFTDDDVLFDRGWLRAYERAFHEHADIAVFGGPIRPRYDRPPPEWLMAFAPCSIRGFNLRGDVHEIDLRQVKLLGANWAVRRAVLDAVGGFRNDLGVGTGGVTLLGEEYDLQLKLADAGARALYLPDAALAHYVPPERCSIEFVLGREEAYGRTLVRMGQQVEASRQLGGVPLWAWREFVASAVPAIFWRMAPSGPRKMKRLIRYHRSLGTVREFADMARTRGAR